ncbi:hypothetical protein BDP27DRAFT_1404742 [Rhodocollybia butyracea]|uniref:Uncharacterized protein n=1 Tax=Rhodocollybia butyracea TaxID=206335 RepID=A0A9P5PND0_9AGAR|nr:hypothetical protein BDP27DRAFT_1404742 [Rhodocollybia butyracea]
MANDSQSSYFTLGEKDIHVTVESLTAKEICDTKLASLQLESKGQINLEFVKEKKLGRQKAIATQNEYHRTASQLTGPYQLNFSRKWTRGINPDVLLDIISRLLTACTLNSICHMQIITSVADNPDMDTKTWDKPDLSCNSMAIYSMAILMAIYLFFSKSQDSDVFVI